MTTQNDNYENAKKQVARIREFYLHLIVYMIINAMLLMLDLVTGPGFWFFWPLMGWGIGLAMHALNTFRFRGMLGTEWEEKKIQEFMGNE